MNCQGIRDNYCSPYISILHKDKLEAYSFLGRAQRLGLQNMPLCRLHFSHVCFHTTKRSRALTSHPNAQALQLQLSCSNFNLFNSVLFCPYLWRLAIRHGKWSNYLHTRPSLNKQSGSISLDISTLIVTF